MARLREHEIVWTPEPIFQERDVYVLGGGPSLAQCDLSVINEDIESVIAVNSAYKEVLKAGLEGGLLFFTDTGWWNSHPEVLAEWLPRRIVTLSRTAKRDAPFQVHRIQHAVPSHGFPDYGASAVRWGRSSGHTAVALAVALGAKRIILLGFDMRVVDGRSHFHTEKADATSPGVYEGYVRDFAGWNAAAKEIGVEIVNATPGSALDEFEKVNFLGLKTEPEPEVTEEVMVAPMTTKDFPVAPQRMSFTGRFNLWQHRK
jgi:hypothetical protein